MSYAVSPVFVKKFLSGAVLMKEMFIIGDSISIHYRPLLAQFLKGNVSFELNQKELQAARIDLDNPMGVNAGDSSRILQKFPEYEDSGLLNCDLLLLNCGLHDIKRERGTHARQVDIDLYRRNLVSILSQIENPSDRVLWVNTTPVDDEMHNAKAAFDRFNDDVIAYNEVAREVMQARQVRAIDLYALCRTIPGELYCDHVHFTEEVRALQAAFIAGWVYSRI